MACMAEAKNFVGKNGVLPRVSINVSMHSLHQLEFPDAMIALARQYTFPPEALASEITESRLMSEISHTLDVADAAADEEFSAFDRRLRHGLRHDAPAAKRAGDGAEDRQEHHRDHARERQRPRDGGENHRDGPRN